MSIVTLQPGRYDPETQFKRLDVWKNNVAQRNQPSLASDRDREFVSDLLKTAYELGYIAQDSMEYRLETVMTVPVMQDQLVHALEHLPLHREEFHPVPFATNLLTDPADKVSALWRPVAVVATVNLVLLYCLALAGLLH